MLTPFDPSYTSIWGSWRCVCMTHSKKNVCAYTPSSATHSSGTPRSGRLLSTVHTLQLCRQIALRSRSQPLWRYTERPWPAPALCPGHLEYIRARGILDPLPGPAGWVPSQAQPFSTPAWLIGGLTHWLPLQSPHTVTEHTCY